MKTLVLGASTNENRYANIATKKLLRFGHDVILVGKKEGNVNGISILTQLTNRTDIDTLTVYLSEKNQEEYAETIENMLPRRVIFNPGAENEKLAQRLENKGVEVLNACTLVMLSTGEY
jgi:uncharacterized protein